jgi:HNH endonuclease
MPRGRVAHTVDWFWSQVDRSGDGCWEWQGRLDRGGYGRIGFQGKTWWVHRLSLHLTGVDLGDFDVCHRCDNPKCVRPSHLFLGTAKDNAADMMAKGRWGGVMGEKHHSAKLTFDDVSHIRTLAGLASQRELARAFGVSRVTIKYVLDNRIWKEAA